ncbi:MAG: ChaN family lipoprotein [Bacteroidota bacterium]|nr:ChaN family lipoprotein [Bacteroidota bacterium]
MKMRYLSLVLLAVLSLNVVSQDMPVYKIFDKNGELVTYEAMIQSLESADITLFGELHNNPVSHWMQYEVTASLYKSHGENLVLGAEMFEADQQMLLDEYLSGLVSADKFEADARLWPNYETDYKHLLDFAKANSLQFVAANIPRRYASIVFKGGFEALETLSDFAKAAIAPLPVKYDPELPGYAAMMKMGRRGMPAHVNKNLPKAQAIKDATMAYFIDKYMVDESKFIHYNGAYHSDNFEGIMWYLQQINSEYKIKTISTVIQSDVNKLDESNQGVADFILVVDENLTGSY